MACASHCEIRTKGVWQQPDKLRLSETVGTPYEEVFKRLSALGLHRQYRYCDDISNYIVCLRIGQMIILSEKGRGCKKLLNRQQKEAVVKKFHEKFLAIKTAILTDFRGLNVDAMNDLRRQLKAESVKYSVIKNTLLARAAQDTDMALIKDYFVGPCAVGLSKEDPVVPAKILVKFAEKNSALKIKAGLLDGKVLDINAIKALADLPSREVLLANLLSAMNGVPTGLVVTLSGVIRNLLGVLTALKDQKGKAA